MLVNPGRISSDIKVTKSINNLPYTNLVVIVGVIETSSNTYKLFSPLTAIQNLPHAQLSTPSTVSVASTSANDTALGTGARVVVVSGLGSDYLFYEEIVIMNGQTPVTTTGTFAKVFELFILAYGSNVDANTGDSVSVGDLYVGTGAFVAGVPANPIAGISQSENNPNSREGIFTVPDGKIFLIKSIVGTVEPDKKENTSLEILIGAKIFGWPDTQWTKTTPYISDSAFQVIPEFNLPIPPRTDIQLRGKINGVATKKASFELTGELQDLR